MTSPYQVLPDLSDDEYARLKASIAERGVEVPVIEDEAGNVIDGHNRARIARELGIDYPREVRRGLPEHEKRILAVTLNLDRRHLTDAQRALAGTKIEVDYAEWARLRELAGKRPDPSDNCHEGRTTDAVAEAVGLGSGRTYERAKDTIAEVERESDGPELVRHLEEGDWTLRQARQELRRRKPVVKTVNMGAVREKVSPYPAGTMEAIEREVAAWSPEVAEAFDRMTVEDDEPHFVREHLHGTMTGLLAARKDLRTVRPELLRRYAANDDKARELIDKAIKVATEVANECRAAVGADAGSIRRVV